jgi:endonuclease V-like protein UPF0215 family
MIVHRNILNRHVSFISWMKRQIRILGIDDAPFTFREKYAAVIGVVMRGGEYLECVLRSQVTIDGTEATLICKEMIQHSRHRHQLKVIMVDGACLGGFNVVDINDLSESTNIPVITITRDKPNLSKIKRALQKNFTDWKDRWSLLQKGKLYSIITKHNPIYIKFKGISLEEAKEIINISTIRGVIPEPVRVAHLIASGITRGESYGKA